MSHKSLLIALTAFTALTLSQAAHAQFDTKTSALIEKDFIQENTATRANVDTMIGSASGSAGHIQADARVGGNISIKNRGANARVSTKLGSVAASSASASPAEQLLDPLNLMPDGMKDFITGGSSDKNLSARGVVGKDLIVDNKGADAMVATDIGSITGAKRSAQAYGEVRGSVVHVNTGDKATSAVLIGSVR